MTLVSAYSDPDINHSFTKSYKPLPFKEITNYPDRTKIIHKDALYATNDIEVSDVLLDKPDPPDPSEYEDELMNIVTDIYNDLKYVNDLLITTNNENDDLERNTFINCDTSVTNRKYESKETINSLLTELAEEKKYNLELKLKIQSHEEYSMHLKQKIKQQNESIKILRDEINNKKSFILLQNDAISHIKATSIQQMQLLRKFSEFCKIR